MDLLEKTIQLINERPYNIKLADIAKATGTTTVWLSKLANGGMNDPSVVKVQAVYEFLSNKKLEV